MGETELDLDRIAERVVSIRKKLPDNWEDIPRMHVNADTSNENFALYGGGRQGCLSAEYHHGLKPEKETSARIDMLPERARLTVRTHTDSGSIHFKEYLIEEIVTYPEDYIPGEKETATIDKILDLIEMTIDTYL